MKNLLFNFVVLLLVGCSSKSSLEQEEYALAPGQVYLLYRPYSCSLCLNNDSAITKYVAETENQVEVILNTVRPVEMEYYKKAHTFLTFPNVTVTFNDSLYNTLTRELHASSSILFTIDQNSRQLILLSE